MRPRHLLLFVAAVATVLRAADSAHEHHGAAMNPAQAELGSGAVFDTKGGLWAVHRVSGHIAVSRSQNEGRTWSSPVLVTTAPEPADSGGDARPKIAAGPHGEIYVTWTKPLGKPYTGEIKFSRSVDDGRTFTAPIVVHRDRQEITHRFDAIAVTASGQVFVAWIDKRDALAQGPDYRGAAIYFAVSDNEGETFRGDFKMADHSCECCRIALHPEPDGSVVAMWRHVFEPNIRDHAFARLKSDGTSSIATRATFSDWRIDACPHHGPGLAEDERGRLHAVWFSGAAREPGVFYGRLGQHGVEGQVRVGGETAEHADVALDGTRVAVAWKEFDGERTQLRGMVSRDGGNSWRQLDLAATIGPSDQPHLLTSPGKFFVFWNSRDEPLRVIPLP